MYLNVKLSIYWHCHLSSFILLKYAAARINNGNLIVITVSTHSHPKMAARKKPSRFRAFFVSTHSRAKAAAYTCLSVDIRYVGFNTQPREGGCLMPLPWAEERHSFNTQPREGGCASIPPHPALILGFNTQPREGGCELPSLNNVPKILVSTHSRAKAAAPYLKKQEKSAY